MNHTLIDQIIAEKIPCYFVSPHLDDAVFSAGGLLAYLSRHTRVEVITVFTHASQRPYSLSAKAFLRQCQATDADALFAGRRAEDTRALEVVGIKPHHLGYADALWRKIASPGILGRMLGTLLPEFLHVYPTYRLHIVSGNVSAHDGKLKSDIGTDLLKIIDTTAPYAVFCPLALRSHIDHVIVRDVCLASFTNVILWRDFPYNLESGLSARDIRALGNEVFRFDNEKDTKRAMIEAYTSQVNAMFPGHNIPTAPEVYYSPVTPL